MSRPILPEGRLARELRLTGVHFRAQLVEMLRTPVAVIGNLVFPSVALLFFVVPQRALAGDPVVATAATAQLSAFAITSTCMFTFGLGVAEDRDKPFAPYLRTLPVGAVPALAGRVLNGILWAFVALVPLTAVGGLLTEARLGWDRLVPTLLSVVGVATPFTLLGLAIGYSLSARAAIAVVQVSLFPLAFAGGMFMPPEAFPGWLEAVSGLTPTRGARELLVAAATGTGLEGRFAVVLVAWTVVFAALVTLAYRRGEGRSYR